MSKKDDIRQLRRDLELACRCGEALTTRVAKLEALLILKPKCLHHEGCPALTQRDACNCIMSSNAKTGEKN